MKDPTYQELYDYLAGNSDAKELEFEIEEAIYWFACNYHGGQWSNLYSVLSTSKYSPGAAAYGPSEPYLYDMLVEEFSK